MNKNTLKTKIAAACLAGTLALGLHGVMTPATAEALSAGSIIGAVIGGAVSASQANSYIKHYNNTEEGRQEYFRTMKEKYGVNNDPYLNNRLAGIMTNLTRAIGQVDGSIYEKPYNYFINNEKSFNAFCTLGHNMSVNTGLFKVINNEDEIAVVLGHEMGHGQKDHPAKGMKRSIGPQILANATGSIVGVLVANAWNNQGITKPMEWEADNLAFEYMTHSPYNPGACAAVWQRVIDKGGDNKSSSFAHFMAGGSDHPSNSSRRDNYAKKLTEYSGKHVSVQNGKVQINGKNFVTPAPGADMSGAERSYFVAGNLAAAFHNGHNKSDATVNGNIVMLGAQPIMECLKGDENPQTLADRLNAIK